MIRFYPLVVFLQIFCLYHAYTNKSEQKWFLIIFFLPFLGSLFYLYTHFYSRQNLSNVKEGVKGTFVKNYKINRLEKELEFSNTFTNKMELAEEHSRVGNLNRAIELYESCNHGLHANDAGLALKLIRNQYLNENHEEVVKYGKQLKSVKEFANSNEKTAYAWSLFRLGKESESQQVFDEMDVQFANYQNRLEYVYFLQEADRNSEAKEKIGRLMEEIKVMDSYEKNINKLVIRDIKSVYNKMMRE